MPRVCSICTHPKRIDIEKLLCSGATPLRNIAARFGTTPAALHRHKSEHLLRPMVQAKVNQEIAGTISVLGHVQKLQNRAEYLYGEAESILREVRESDPQTALKAIREASIVTRESRGHAELQARLTGELDSGGRGATVQQLIIVMPEAPATEPKAIDVKASAEEHE